MARMRLIGLVIMLTGIVAMPSACGEAGSHEAKPSIRSLVGEFRYADFADVIPYFSLEEKPNLTFRVYFVDLGGCADSTDLVPAAIRNPLAESLAGGTPPFYGFYSAEIYCRAEADGKRFVAVAFVVGSESIPMFWYRVGPEGFSDTVTSLGRANGPTWGSRHGLEVLVHRGFVTHFVFLGQARLPEGEPFALVYNLATKIDDGPFHSAFRIAEEPDGTYLYALDAEPRYARGKMEVTALRFGGLEKAVLFHRELDCVTPSCESPEDIEQAVKEFDSLLVGKKLVPIRME